MRPTLGAILSTLRPVNLAILVMAEWLTWYCLASPGGWPPPAPPLSLVWMSLSAALVAAAGYLINDYYDVKIDAVNRPETVVIGRTLSRRQALALQVFLNFLGIGMGFLASWHIAVVNFAVAFSLWVYSNQLKRLPLVGNVVISLLSAMAVLVVGIYYGAPIRQVLFFGFFAGLLSLIRELVKDLEDLRGDLRYDCRTLPIVWGIRNTKVLLLVLLGLFAANLYLLSGLLLPSELLLYYIVLGLPMVYYIALLWRADRKRHYAQLSAMAKLMMVAGMLSMLFFYD